MSDLMEAEEIQKRLEKAQGEERASLKEQLNKCILTRQRLWKEEREHEQRKIKIITGED